MRKRVLQKNYGVTPVDIQRVIDSIAPASRDSVPAEPTPTQEQEQKQEQKQEHAQEESPLEKKVFEIVEKNISMIAIEQELRVLHAERKKAGEKISLGTLKAQAKEEILKKKERAAREREAERRQQERARIDNQDVSEARVIEQINAGHAVVQYGNRVLILYEALDPILDRPTLALLAQSDFRLKFLNRTVLVPRGEKVVPVSWGDLWLEHRKRREYDGIVFVPKDEAPQGYYNVWRGLAVTPKKGKCERLLSHLRDVICNGNKANYDYLLKWCAHAVQRTDELPGVAVVLRSAPGTGKNTFVDALGQIFGRHYLPLNQNGLLCGRFTAHLANAVLVFANEAVWGGDKQGEGRLKAMITDGMETIEAKGKDAITIPNFKRIIVASNESWAVPRAIGDRRFFCLDVSPARIGNEKYFAALHEEINNGGIEAFLYELLDTDIKGWHPWASMPATNTDGEDMKLMSLSTPLQWWLHSLIVGKNTLNNVEWEPAASEEDMHKAYLDYCATHRKAHIEHLARFKAEIKRAVVYEVTRPGKRGSPRPEIRRIPSLEECRKHFQSRIAKYQFDEPAMHEETGDEIIL